jgi:hypothetical protein
MVYGFLSFLEKFPYTKFWISGSAHVADGFNELHTWRKALRPPKPLAPPLLEMEMCGDTAVT